MSKARRYARRKTKPRSSRLIWRQRDRRPRRRQRRRGPRAMKPGGRLETSKRSADEQGQALREAQDKAEKLAADLAAARQEAEAQTAAARAASDEARRAARDEQTKCR